MKDVQLGQVSERSLSTVGDASKWEETVIQFRDCNLGTDSDDAVKAVHLTVASGPAAAGNNKLWKNHGDAGNVGVEVQIGGSTVTPAGIADDDENFKMSIENTSDPLYRVRGRMVATGKATAGDVKSVVTFVAKYK